MSDFLIAPAASSDLEEVWNYYAVECGDIEAADRVTEEIFRAFEKLARTPGIGHFRSDLAAEPLRFWRVKKYLIIYRSEKRPIEIARVLHAARDVDAILGGKHPGKSSPE